MDRKLQRHRADSLRQHGFLVFSVIVSHEASLVCITVVRAEDALMSVFQGIGEVTVTIFTFTMDSCAKKLLLHVCIITATVVLMLSR